MVTVQWTVPLLYIEPCWDASATAARSSLHNADPLFGIAVLAADLVGDDFSSQVLADFNSVDVLIDVSIDNTAWFPELGYLAATTHDRLKNIMKSEGYDVVTTSSVCLLCGLFCAVLPALCYLSCAACDQMTHILSLPVLCCL